MTVLAGRYELLQPLSQGTYAAQDLHQPEQPLPCVVKQISLTPGQSPDILKKEAKVLQSLGEHPQIPRLLAYFEAGDQFCLVQEQIQGYPLSQEIHPGHTLEPDAVMALLHDLLTLLVVVHEHAVIHRDIRPDNILRRYGDRKLCLVGFSIAKQLDPAIPQGRICPNSVMQSCAYTAPEQTKGQVSASSDLYAVGQIAIAALTGISPQQRHNPDPTQMTNWRKQANICPTFADYLDTLAHPNLARRFDSAQRALDQLAQVKAKAEAANTVVAAPARQPIPSTLSKQPSIKVPTRPLLVGTGTVLAGLVMWGLGLQITDWWHWRGAGVDNPSAQATQAYREASPDQLVCLYDDCAGGLQLQPAANTAFWQMSVAAAQDDVKLYPLQAFQSRAAKQASLAELSPSEQATKLAQSDYPTGYALAIGDLEDETADFSQSFAETDAFRWLEANGADFGFELSFPDSSPEPQPWRWRYIGDEDSQDLFAE